MVLNNVAKFHKIQIKTTGLIDWTQSNTVNFRERNQNLLDRERSGSVVECLTRDRRAVGSSLTAVTALWSLSKTHLS